MIHAPSVTEMCVPHSLNTRLRLQPAQPNQGFCSAFANSCSSLITRTAKEALRLGAIAFVISETSWVGAMSWLRRSGYAPTTSETPQPIVTHNLGLVHRMIGEKTAA